MVASIEQQVTWAKTSALVVAAPERCVLKVTGSERLSWLNGLLTSEMASRRDGEAVYGLAVAQKGKIVSDVVALVLADAVLLIVQRKTVGALVASFEHHLMMEDAELSTTEDAVTFVHGPSSASVVSAMQSRGAHALPFDETDLGGGVIVGGDGAAIDAAAVAAGGGRGDGDGWDAVRVMAGVPKFGVDFDDATYPQEASLEKRAVSFEKGCYLGQEVVCMLEMRGHVKKKLVSLAIDADGATDEPAGARSPVEDDKGGAIGEVTSVVRSPSGETRALAMLKYAFIAPGTAVKVGGHPARVVEP